MTTASISSTPSNATSFTVVKDWHEGAANYQELKWGDFIITLRLADSAPKDAESLPSKVTEGSKIWWQFDKTGPATMTFLREYGDEPVLVMTNRHQVLEILFLKDLPLIMRVKVKGGLERVIPARSITELALCKREMAIDMVREPVFTNEEKTALQIFDAEQRKKDQAARARAQREAAAEKSAKAAEHAAKIAKIMARPEVVCYTKSNGDRRHGYPVIGDEWMSLKNSTFCILVASYDETTGEHGDVIECFRVAKNGTRVSKMGTEEVQAEKISTATTVEELEAEDVLKVDIAGEVLMVPLYVNVKPSDVQLPRFAVASAGKATVYCRKGKNLHTLGVLEHQMA